MKNEIQYLVLVKEGATKSKTWYEFSEGNLAKYAKALSKKKIKKIKKLYCWPSNSFS